MSAGVASMLGIMQFDPFVSSLRLQSCSMISVSGLASSFDRGPVSMHGIIRVCILQASRLTEHVRLMPSLSIS